MEGTDFSRIWLWLSSSIWRWYEILRSYTGAKIVTGHLKIH